MRVVSVSLPEAMVDELDELSEEEPYSGRSEIFRAALRPFLQNRDQEARRSGSTTATLTLCYEEGVSEMVNRRRHEHGDPITTMVHSHISPDRCLEVLVLDGDTEDIRSLADELRGRRGIEQVKLVWTS